MAALRPNVVLVITDDQGYGDLGCHGNPTVRTPQLDAFHAEAVRLTDFHVGPTCAPTRAGLLTGHFANSTGVWHTIGGRSLLRRDEVGLANLFADAGYATGLFGKWHLGDNFPYRPQDRGFQEVVTHGGGGVGNTSDHWGNCYLDDAYCTNGEWIRYDGYCTDVWFRLALDFIERHSGDRDSDHDSDRSDDAPFFCCIAPNAPHHPYIVEPKYAEPYRDVTPHRERADYFGMVANIDENFGQLRKRLNEIADNTILIFMTDNGSAGGVDVDEVQRVTSGHNCGMRGRKGSEYDGGHRVPFFVRWPLGGIEGGRDVAALTAHVDVVPTLAELCDLGDVSRLDLDGISLAPALRGDALDVSDRIVVTDSQRLARPKKWRKSAVMSERWRLINGRELYDMAADPGQTSDVASLHPEVVATLREAYERWWVRVTARADEAIAIPIGESGEPRLLICSHDWRNIEDPECVWNQNQVREGVETNGYWEVDVAVAGRYRFELRRWPREEDRGLAEGIPGEVVSIRQMTWERGYGGGNALPIASAELSIGGVRRSTALSGTDTAAVFELDLQPGPTELRTRFSDGEGLDVGAYYVYVQSLGVGG